MTKALRFFFLLIGCAAVAARGALAPDSVVGKVFHYTSFATTTRGSTERTVILRSDGQAEALRLGHGSALNLSAPFRLFLADPPANVTYSYTRSGESTATFVLTEDALTNIFLLTFTSPNGGTMPDFAGGPQTFYFTDLSAVSTAAVANISVRGRAVPGRPVIAGFVIPGTPTPISTTTSTADEREVLIRAVGPSLTTYGVTDVWADPNFVLMRDNAPAQTKEVIYPDWTTIPPLTSAANPVPAFNKIFAYAGAFPLLANSKDAAAVVRLTPGAYTIVCDPPAGDAGGEVLIELYVLP